MAEAALFNIAQLLFNKLGSVALDEIASTYGFKTNLKKLNDSVNTIKNVLLDAQERQVESHAVRGWLGRLRSVVYDADDLFDEFATMASQRDAMAGNSLSKEVRTFFSSSNRISFAFSISKRIEKIREELDDIVKDSSEFGFKLRPREEGSLCKQYRESHSFVHGEDVIGRDEDRKAVIDMLTASCTSQEQRLSVVPIVGIGGLGKTTLAQLIYNDKLIEKHFELKLWVCVSENFDVKEVIKKIIMSATNSSESENLTIDQLQGKLRKEIGGKKYLLVLDDVWNELREEWLKLSALLKVGGEGSKILMTTRSMKVAYISGGTGPTYVLAGLSEEKSWALFEKMAFGPGESQNKPHLVKIGKEITKKCAAVPLALRALGSLLRGSDERKWVSVANNSFAELPLPDNQRIMAILKLSYDNLLSPLKCCFAYCALFPKNYELEKETLLDLWMAEGFVVPAVERQSLDDVGDEYLTNLLQRCFFQDIKRDKWGNISSFKMHDLMHDLALQVSETESKMAMSQNGNFSEGVRHLSFGYRLSNSWEIPVSILKAKQLRTFLLPYQISDGTDFNIAVLRQLISNFRCLRVLDLNNLKIPSLPKTIGKLIHLRYLNLSMNPLKQLPHSITRLLNLQTLILRHCQRLTALPVHTRNLTNLRSLDLRGCVRLTHMPPGLGELTSLQKLSYFVVPEKRSSKFMRNLIASGLKDLKTLNNLRGDLQISFCDDFEGSASEIKEANLSSKEGLTELVVECTRNKWRCGIYNDEAKLEGLKPHQNLKKLVVGRYSCEMLPSWVMRESLFTTLPNLVEIHLNKLSNCRQVPSFSQLPFLRCLILDRLTKVEYMEKSQNGLKSSALSSTETFFPSLQELVLIGMHNLKGWWEETKATDSTDQGEASLSFSELAKLRIESCPKLASFPLSPNVEELSLEDVNKHLNVLKKLTGSTVNDDFWSSVDFWSSETTSEYRPKLKTLSIDKVAVLIYLPKECLGHITSLEIQEIMFWYDSTFEEVFKRLTSLSCLMLTNCKNLTQILDGLEHLTKLDKLVIQACCDLGFSQNVREDGMPWKALTSLRSLHFCTIHELEHLPSGLQHLTNLRSLRLTNIRKLKALPEWISCFSSLEYMELNGCPKLSCLPEEIGKLTTLSALDIKCCHRLTFRCRGPNGREWPKIRHIPLLIVDDYDYDVPT